MRDALALDIAVYAGFMFCIIVHECAHVLVAAWRGDDTSWLLGRFTLNPIPHIDPFMSILLPVALFLSGQTIFGGAKPVPVNMHQLRGNRLFSMSLVALAGPVSNLILAAVFAVSLNLAFAIDRVHPVFAGNFWVVAWRLVQVNVMLALFNLIPIPPLDGSRILAVLLPGQSGWKIYEWERIGILLVALLVLSGGAFHIITAPVDIISTGLIQYLCLIFHT